MLLYLGGTRQFNLKSGMGGTAGRQLMAPHGCAAEENQHHSPQAGALRGTRILHKATMVLPLLPQHPKTIRERAKHTRAPHMAICYQRWLALSLLPLGDKIQSPAHNRTHHPGTGHDADPAMHSRVLTRQRS